MNMTSVAVSSILTSLGVQFPLIAVCFLGLVLTLSQMERLPRVSLLVGTGLGLLLLVAVVQPLLQPFISNLVVRDMGRGMNPQMRTLLFYGIAFLFNVIRAIAIGLVAYAAFVGRPLQAYYDPSLAGRAWSPAGGPGDALKPPGAIP